MDIPFKILLLVIALSITKGAIASDEISLENYSISYSGISFYNVHPDLDRGEDNSGNLFNHDFNDGRGNGFRLSVNVNGTDPSIMSLSYINGTHEDKTTKEEAASDLILFELGEHFATYETDIVSLHAGIQGGLGGFFIRPASDTDDKGLAMSVRLFTDVIFADRFKITFSGLYFGAGYPGETVMNGYFVSFDTGIIF